MGLDTSPVWPQAAAAAYELWQTIDSDEIDDDPIVGSLYSSVEKLSANLRRQNRCTEEVSLIVQYSDGYEIRKKARLVAPSDLESTIFAAVQALFLSTDRRVCVRRLGVSLSAMRQPGEQLSLFGQVARRSEENLIGAVLAIRSRYGEQSIRRGIVNAAQ